MTALNIDHFERGYAACISGKTRHAHGYNWHALVAITAWEAGYAYAAQQIHRTAASNGRVDVAQVAA